MPVGLATRFRLQQMRSFHLRAYPAAALTVLLAASCLAAPFVHRLNFGWIAEFLVALSLVYCAVVIISMALFTKAPLLLRRSWRPHVHLSRFIVGSFRRHRAWFVVWILLALIFLLLIVVTMLSGYGAVAPVATAQEYFIYSADGASRVSYGTYRYASVVKYVWLASTPGFAAGAIAILLATGFGEEKNLRFP